MPVLLFQRALGHVKNAQDAHLARCLGSGVVWELVRVLQPLRGLLVPAVRKLQLVFLEKGAAPVLQLLGLGDVLVVRHFEPLPRWRVAPPEQLDLKLERRKWRDFFEAILAVRVVGTDVQLRLLSAVHRRHAFVPAGNDVIPADLEFEGDIGPLLLLLARRVKLDTIRQQRANEVHFHLGALKWLAFGRVALDEDPLANTTIAGDIDRIARHALGPRKRTGRLHILAKQLVLGRLVLLQIHQVRLPSVLQHRCLRRLVAHELVDEFPSGGAGTDRRHWERVPGSRQKDDNARPACSLSGPPGWPPGIECEGAT